jgi:glycosyltransferase involved in cell wall biosynthesis
MIPQPPPGTQAAAAPQVLFLTRKWAPAVGGMESYSMELARELSRRLPFRTIALPGRADGGPPSSVALAGFAVKSVRTYLGLEQAPDVLHLGDLASWPLALLGRLRRKRPRIVISAHGTDVSYPRRGGVKGRVYGAYLRLGARLLGDAQVIANSAATARAAAENGWRVAQVVPLGTRLSVSAPPAPSPSPTLLFAGRLIPQKGCAWFVEQVLPRLPADYRLRVAGTVWDEAERVALAHPRVEFLGPLDPAALAQEFGRATCVIVPNIERASGEFEGFGLVAAEAAACGGVVVAADTGGLREAVLDGRTGFRMAPGDAEAWAARITEIANWPPERRRQHVLAAMAEAQRFFCWSRVANDVRAVYGEAPCR